MGFPELASEGSQQASPGFAKCKGPPLPVSLGAFFFNSEESWQKEGGKKLRGLSHCFFLFVHPPQTVAPPGTFFSRHLWPDFSSTCLSPFVAALLPPFA